MTQRFEAHNVSETSASGKRICMRLFDLSQIDVARRQHKAHEKNLRELEQQKTLSARDPERGVRRTARNSFRAGSHLP